MKIRNPETADAQTKRCAIYTRKSTAAGLDQQFTSLDAQRAAGVAYVERQPGWVVLDTRYDDGGFTGASTDRPAFQRLLADVDGGKIDIVIVYKVDRLSRSLLDFAQIVSRLNAAGVSFVSVTQNFSTADAMGRLTLNMLMSFAEFEREMIAERTRDKIAAAKRKGIWVGGVPPVGYTAVDKKLVAHEREASLVREIFSLYLQHRSALEVTKRLNESGRAKRHRGEADPVRQQSSWTSNDVFRVLKNPLYAGWMVVGGERFEAAHPALVDRKTFDHVQAVLADGTFERRPAQRNPEYLLRGLLHCAGCGAAFTAASTRSPSGTEHRYYRCVTKDKRGKKACPSRPLPAAALEQYVVEQVRDAIEAANLAAELTVALNARIAARRAELEAEQGRLPREVAARSAELKRQLDTLGGLTGAARRVQEERLEDIGKELTRAEQRLAEVERQVARLDHLVIEAGWVADCLANFGTTWGVLTPHDRARLVQVLVKRIELDEPNNQVRVYFVDLESEGAATP